MLKLNGNYEVDRKFLNFDYIRFSPAETTTINTPNSHKNNIIPIEGSVFSLLISCFDLNFEVIKKTDDNRYANGNDIRLVNLRPIASFSEFTLTTSCGKHLEDDSHAQIVCLKYKLIPSAKNSSDLSIGFHRDQDGRWDKLAHNKTIEGKDHDRNLLKDVTG